MKCILKINKYFDYCLKAKNKVLYHGMSCIQWSPSALYTEKQINMKECNDYGSNDNDFFSDNRKIIIYETLRNKHNSYGAALKLLVKQKKKKTFHERKSSPLNP